ncbi:MAG: RNA-binding protein [Proteobacteria bacterium SG_bin7]|nr:MAG: RNA-binding protein [Proteobacteria bacterium SG_bin7]
MSNKLYVGQLPYSVDSDALGNHFSAVGQVVSAKVITDRDSGRSKGFGFVEMQSEEEAQKAIEQLNGKDFNGRNINVSVAKPQESRPRGGGGGGRGGFGGGGRGRY